MKRSTPEHPKMLDLCSRLHVRKWEATGILELLWHFTAKYAPAGDIGKYPDASIARAIDWNRDPERLIDALAGSRWMDRCDCHRLVIHDWPDHAEDAVHMRLARAHERFADGTTPSTKRLPKEEKAHADQYYVQNPCARITHGVQVAAGKPQPLPQPLPKPEDKPPVVPQGGPSDGDLFDGAPAAAPDESMVRPAVPAKRTRTRKPKPEMSAHQRERFGEFLNIHPKNTCQTTSAENLWRDKVKDDELADWLIAQLKRECAGDTTFMYGPGRWLSDHLTLWANGAQANIKPQQPTPDRAMTKGERAVRELWREQQEGIL